jgi:hypothetical protein
MTASRKNEAKSAKGKAEAIKPELKVVPSADSGDVVYQGIHLREILSGIFADEDREYLYRRVIDEKKDGDTDITGEPLAIEFRYDRIAMQTSGMPQLLSVYRTDGKPRGRWDDETFYKVAWSKRPEIEPETFTERELNAGEWLAHTPGIAVTARRERDFYADVVKAQVMPFQIHVGRAVRATGFHVDSCTGRYSYYLRDGRYYAPDLSLINPDIPIAGYNFTEKKKLYAQAWQERAANFTRPVTSADGQRFLSWQRARDAKGRVLLLSCGGYRSFVSTFVPLSTGIMVIAKDEVSLQDGSSMAGKTTTINFARGGDGPCPFNTPAECVFNGTLAGIETRIAPIRDLPISVSDFHMNTNTEKEANEFAEKVDNFIRSAAGEGELKARANRDMTEKAGTTISGLLILDGEKMPPLILSRLRRMIILQFARGEIDTAGIHQGWEEFQAIHTAIGHAVIRNVLTQVNRDETAFKRAVRGAEERYENTLFSRMRAEHKEVEEQTARALARNYAQVVTGAYLADQSVGIPGLIDAVLDAAYGFMCEQAAFIGNGGATCVDRDWIITRTVKLLNKGYGHVVNMQEEDLAANVHGRLSRYGYRPVADGWIAQGVYLANVDDHQTMFYFRPEAWHDELKDIARREDIKWTYNNQTFPGALVRMGIVTPSYLQGGRVGRAAQRPYVNSKQVRRLVVDALLLDMDSAGQDEETPPPAPVDDTPDARQSAVSDQSTVAQVTPTQETAITPPSGPALKAAQNFLTFCAGEQVTIEYVHGIEDGIITAPDTFDMDKRWGPLVACEEKHRTALRYLYHQPLEEAVRLLALIETHDSNVPVFAYQVSEGERQLTASETQADLTRAWNSENAPDRAWARQAVTECLPVWREYGEYYSKASPGVASMPTNKNASTSSHIEETVSTPHVAPIEELMTLAPPEKKRASF